MRTSITIRADESFWVSTSDPDIPDAKINFKGSYPAAECPWDGCGAMVRLQGYGNVRPDGSSYPAHYLAEHLLPMIRRDEGARFKKAESEASEDFLADPERYGP